VPSHLARIEPSGARTALDTRLQAGKLYLMILEATAVASPLGAAPTAGGAANAVGIAENMEIAKAVTVVGLTVFSSWCSR